MIFFLVFDLGFDDIPFFFDVDMKRFMAHYDVHMKL